MTQTDIKRAAVMASSSAVDALNRGEIERAFFWAMVSRRVIEAAQNRRFVEAEIFLGNIDEFLAGPV